MTMLEDALRQTFADNVGTAPLTHDPAGRAIARAAVLRRRQRAVAGTAMIVVLVVLTGGVWLVRDARGGTAVASNAAADSVGAADTFDADVFSGGEIYVGGAGSASSLPSADKD